MQVADKGAPFTSTEIHEAIIGALRERRLDEIEAILEEGLTISLRGLKGRVHFRRREEIEELLRSIKPE